MNMEDLKKLLAAATPGPWQAMAGDPLAVDAHEAVYVCKMTGATPVTRLAANAALIVAAVNALPELLAIKAERDRAQRACEQMGARITELLEENEKLREALRLFMGAATPVSTEIDPRGYVWSLGYLDQARTALKETGQ